MTTTKQTAFKRASLLNLIGVRGGRKADVRGWAVVDVFDLKLTCYFFLQYQRTRRN